MTHAGIEADGGGDDGEGTPVAGPQGHGRRNTPLIVAPEATKMDDNLPLGILKDRRDDPATTNQVRPKKYA